MGEGMSLFAVSCKCGYKGADVFPERSHGPRKIVFRVNTDEDLNTLVARSSTSTVRIPEIGAEIRPGPASTGFITTIEGILFRLKKVFGEKNKKVNGLLLHKKFTLEIFDPDGNSAVDSPSAVISAVNDENAFK